MGEYTSTTRAVLESNGDIPVRSEHRGGEGGSSDGGQVGGAQGGRSVVPHLPNSDAPLPPTLGGISPLLYTLKF